MRLKHPLLTVVALLALAGPAAGQKLEKDASRAAHHQLAPRALSGRVVDAGSGQPIGAAQVEIVGTNRGAITDDDGYFRIVVDDEAPLSGRRDVRAVSIGYAPIVYEDLLIEPGAVIEFRLEPSAVASTNCFILGAFAVGDILGPRASDQAPFGRPMLRALDLRHATSTTWSIRLNP